VVVVAVAWEEGVCEVVASAEEVVASEGVVWVVLEREGVVGVASATEEAAGVAGGKVGAVVRGEVQRYIWL